MSRWTCVLARYIFMPTNSYKHMIRKRSKVRAYLVVGERGGEDEHTGVGVAHGIVAVHV